MENTITLTLTQEEHQALKEILFYWVDQMEYDVEQTIQANDPNGELEELTDHLLVSMSLNKKVTELA
jgi:hypothetical protein